MVGGGPGAPGARFVWAAYIDRVATLRRALLAVVAPGVIAAQVTARPPASSPLPPSPPYRGFSPGIRYRAFVERSPALAHSDVLRCHSSPHTAQILECGVAIRDPRAAARFYLNAPFVEGNAD